jgi:signal transduction histidine kinase/DNA-binding NarL/FixJ family response regulator
MMVVVSNWLRVNGAMAALIREFAWEDTPLGPLREWQQSLRTSVELMLSSGFPTALYMGAAGTHLCNDPWVVVCGETARAKIGHAIFDEREGREAEFVGKLRSARKGETLREEHSVFPFFGGEDDPRRFIVSYSPVYSERGDVQGVSVVAIETVEESLRQQLHAALVARHNAEEADRAKEEFLATASHELRTPLAAISLWVQALRKGGVRANDFARALDAIAQSAESQSRVIEDLLDLARLRSGKVTLEPRSTSLESIADRAMQAFGHIAKQKSIRLDVQVAPAGNLMLDPGRFQQALWNLLSNAFKFTPAGGQVVLRLNKHEGDLEVEVSDTGAGIDPEFLPQLFQRFQQAGGNVRLGSTGLGIGLALCRYFVELHGGTVTGRSEGPGRGASFALRIPWIAPPSEEEEPRKSEPFVKREEATSLQGCRILLVEDDVSTRQVMAWTLQRAGAIVSAVDSGAAALATLGIGRDGQQRHSTDDPDLVVCDIGLSGMSGYDVIRQLTEYRRASGLHRLPACAVSAHARDVDRQQAIDAGFDMHLAKPVTAEQLIEMVALLTDMGSRFKTQDRSAAMERAERKE